MKLRHSRAAVMRSILVAIVMLSAIREGSAQESEREAQDRIARQIGQEAEQRRAFNIVGPVIVCASQVADELIPKAPVRCSNERGMAIANAAYAAFQERCSKQIAEAARFAGLAYEKEVSRAFLLAVSASIQASYVDLAAKAYATRECR
jgi:hypothetical protein